MSGKLFDRYGAILQEDVEVLESCLKTIIDGIKTIPQSSVLHPWVHVVEIGMHDGGTARGMESFVNELGCRFIYTGVDPDDGSTRPRYVPAGGKVIIGDSAEVFGQVPGGIDLLWVDGCHCFNHVVLDVLNYAPKVRPGGFMLFHDVNPVGQGTEHQYHGPDTPEFGLAVNAALEVIRFPWAPWFLFVEKIPSGVHNCGTRAYRKRNG